MKDNNKGWNVFHTQRGLAFLTGVNLLFSANPVALTCKKTGDARPRGRKDRQILRLCIKVIMDHIYVMDRVRVSSRMMLYTSTFWAFFFQPLLR